jgi:hypothetical protein
MAELKSDTASLRREMEQMYETIAYFSKQERSEYVKIIKDFGKMIKGQLDDAREKKDGLVREFDQILRDRGIAKKKLKLCENRVKYLEKITGVEPREGQRETLETVEF